MLKIGGLILDHLDDLSYGFFLSKIAEENRINLDADILSQSDADTLGNSDFAVIFYRDDKKKIRKYPINDKANTQLSLGYFLKQRDKLPTGMVAIISKNLAKACQAYGIDYPKEWDALPDVGNLYSEKIEKAETELDKKDKWNKIIVQHSNIKEAEDKDFGIVEIINGNKERRFPMLNAVMTKQACESFSEKKATMHPKKRRKLAKKIMKKCAEYRLPVPQDIRNYASEKLASTFNEALELRQQYLYDYSQVKTLNEIKKYAEEWDPEKTAEVLMVFDKEAGISHLWDKAIPDPYMSVFGQLVPTPASDSEKILKKIASIKPEDIKQYFNEKLANQWKKDPIKTFNKLDKSTKTVILNKML